MTYDLAIIGAGFSGQAARYFAKKKGLSVCLIGKNWGATAHFSGVFDLVSPVVFQKNVAFEEYDSPEKTYQRYLQFFDKHPYQACDLNFEQLTNHAFDCLSSLTDIQFNASEWRYQILASGQFKPVNASLFGSSVSEKTLKSKPNVLLINWNELPDYNQAVLTQAFQNQGMEVTVHHTKHAINPTSALMSLARQMDDDTFFQNFVNELRAYNCDLLVLPPVLGIFKFKERIEALQKALSCEVVEMQNRLPSIAGLRLEQALSKNIDFKGEVSQIQDGLVFVGDKEISAENILIATGKYIGGGLKKDPLWQESLLNLPLSLQGQLVSPHSTAISLIDSQAKDSQAFMRLGVSVDSNFQPCDPASGQILQPHLYASGHLLPDFDYTREHCGVGVSVATSYKVIDIIHNFLKKS